jgi:uroporphyrinogen III methyltransferase/synthase
MTSILVTRPAGPADPLVELLERRGYQVHAVPTVVTEPVKFDARDLGRCDWIVLTSVNGVDALTDLPPGPQYAAVGEKTAAALRARGIQPAHVPPQSNAAALAGSLPDVEGKRIALVRASAAGSDLPEMLRRRGATVEEITAYATLEGPLTSAEPLRAALGDPGLAAVVFASGSAIRGYIALGGTNEMPAITIGPRTSASAREHGFQVIAEADAQSAEELASAVARAIPLKETKHA